MENQLDYTTLNFTELQPPTGSDRDRDNRYYEIIGGGARLHLMETMLALEIPALLADHYDNLTAAEICTKLALDPKRGSKFIHCLALAGFLLEEGIENDMNARYSRSKQTVDYFGNNGREGAYFRDLVVYWRNVASLSSIDVLRGMPLPEAVKWPPQTLQAAEHLEWWMRITAEGAIETLKQSQCMANAKTLLDIGGGDGTIGCALTDIHPELNVTVFNLPSSAYIARRVIAEKGKTEQVQVHEGDIFVDSMPPIYDRVMYSRVLTDWDADHCVKMLTKAREALAPGGRVIINEALVEGNLNYSLAWEFRYIYYDTFGKAMYKTLSTYETILERAGLKVDKYHPMIPEAFYSVVECVPI